VTDRPRLRLDVAATAYGEDLVRRVLAVIGDVTPSYVETPEGPRCDWCGALVGNAEDHNAWHFDLTVSMHLLLAATVGDAYPDPPTPDVSE
jgi:hypothetical protein